MAKRPNQSQADDSSTTTPAQPRARRSRVAQAPGDLDTLTARGPVGQQRPVELDPDPSGQSARGAQSASRVWMPSEDDIRLRAYHRYLERGGAHGMAFDDWLEAERELKLRG